MSPSFLPMVQIHGLVPGFICLLFSIFSQAVSLLGFLLAAFFTFLNIMIFSHIFSPSIFLYNNAYTVLQTTQIMLMGLQKAFYLLIWKIGLFYPH